MDNEDLKRRLEPFDGSIIKITNYNLQKKREYASETHKVKLEFDPQQDVDEAEEKREADLEKRRIYHRERYATQAALEKRRQIDREKYAKAKGTSKTDSN